MFEITYRPKANRTLRRLDKKTANRIMGAINKLAENPARTDLDIRPLKGRAGYRLRVGDWRVIYTADGNIIAILHIGSRGDVYK